MRNKQTSRPEAHGNQPQRHGARSEFEAMREDTSMGAPHYPRGYSQSQGGTSPRYGAEYGSVEDADPRASQQWHRGASSQAQRPSFGPDYEGEHRGYETSRGSQFDPHAQSGRYQQEYSGAPSHIEPSRSSWQEPDTRRMGQGYGGSSGYGQHVGYGYGRAGTDERPMSYGYEQGFQGGRGEADDQNRSGTSRQALYQGRGPRNYTRSNERILEEVNERLTDDPWLDASDITVRCVDGRVQLEGHVRDRWMKHRAEDIADACMGVREIDNRLRIQVSGESLSTGSATDATLSETSNAPRGQGTSASQPVTSQSNRPAH